jgi:ATP-dependent 26S proteasome regulatory subunit
LRRAPTGLLLEGPPGTGGAFLLAILIVIVF